MLSSLAFSSFSSSWFSLVWFAGSGGVLAEFGEAAGQGGEEEELGEAAAEAVVGGGLGREERSDW